MSLPFDFSPGLIGHYGALPASRPKLFVDRVMTVPFEFPIDPKELSQLRLGIFAHIFYPELSGEFIAALSRIPIAFDLYISTDSVEKKAGIAEIFRSFRSERLTIEAFPNRGRDIAPFIVGFGDKIPLYDVVAHIHSKTSKHDDILTGWREYLFRQMFGSPEIISSILYAFRTGAVDVLFPDHFAPVRQSLNFGFDYPDMSDLLARAGIKFSKDTVLEFPSSSMLWATPKALTLLLNLKLRFEDFPEEQGQIDGTLAHAIERSLLFMTEGNGGRWARFADRAATKDTSRLIPVCKPNNLPIVLGRASRRLLGNRLSINVDPRFAPEIPAIGFRGETSERPRFTLLIPTLRPEKVFGGVASALRLFERIRVELGDQVDARVVSATDGVEADCLSTAEGYTLIPLGAQNTELPRTIVDASGVRAEQLPIRQNEVFLATAWWTAYWAFQAREMQKSLFGHAPSVCYFIQDHEPDFYGWSTKYALAQSTYRQPEHTMAIINSEELYNFFEKKYGFKEAHVVPYRINQTLRRHFQPVPKERIILVYGRPGTPRNAFEILVDGLCLWQQSDPLTAREWRIVSVGEVFDEWRVKHLSNFEILGKLPLQEYAMLLCRAAVGVSLMVSPHPSYPPLEMAEAGAITITNAYDQKDLSRRSPNISSIDVLTPERLGTEVAKSVERAKLLIGQPSKSRSISAIECLGTTFSAKAISYSIRSFLNTTGGSKLEVHSADLRSIGDGREA